MPNVNIERAAHVAANNSDALYNLAPGTLVADGKDRVFMVIAKPGAGMNRDVHLVRLCAPPGFYDVEVQYPVRLFEGEATIRN